MAEAFSTSVDEAKTKFCSVCESKKNLSEFYRQRDRFESCCRSCKKKKREQKNSRSNNESSSSFDSCESKEKIQQNKKFVSLERDHISQFDESIFYPEKVGEKFGLTIDDLSNVVSFVRWQLDQKNKITK